ncbi:MAG: hypothetical protein CMO98_13400 [Woeseia sp.]|nr:hypothetical protein [Woeseia sp.]|tara:strand:- start:379 stop:603 length:225 start_codon:yes stop_codon:yes gene_type:complete
MKPYLFSVFVLALTLIPNVAFAYIDPGSASLFITLLIGVLAGAAVAIRTYWTKLKSFFGGGASKDTVAQDDLEK